MFDFVEGTSQTTKDYFGFNTGEPWDKPKSSGMLDGTKGMMSYPCNDVNKTVPYFKKFN